MAHARPFWTSTLQDLFNDIKKSSRRGVLTPAIALWRFGVQLPTWEFTWECEGSLPHPFLHSREYVMWLLGFLLACTLATPLPWSRAQSKGCDKRAPLDFSLYIRESDFWQTISIKQRCNQEHLEEPFGNPNTFLLCSFQVPNGFPLGSKCVPQRFSEQQLALIPYTFNRISWNLFLFSLVLTVRLGYQRIYISNFVSLKAPRFSNIGKQNARTIKFSKQR
jgi:hypothetical protein